MNEEIKKTLTRYFLKGYTVSDLKRSLGKEIDKATIELAWIEFQQARNVEKMANAWANESKLKSKWRRRK